MPNKILPRLLLGFLLISVLPLAGLSYLYLEAFENALEKTITENLTSIANKKMDQVRTYIHNRSLESQFLAKADFIYQTLQSANALYQSNPDVQSNRYQQILLMNQKSFSMLFNSNDYHDLLLANLQGDVVFSIRRENDLGTNLNTGIYKDGVVAKAHREALALMETQITDVEPYAPSNNVPSLFMVTPVFRNNEMIGTVILQLNLESLTQVAEDKTGLGETGETVLGQRHENEVLYTGSLQHIENAAFHYRVDFSKTAPPMLSALSGVVGNGVTQDYVQQKVFAVWRYLPSLRWGMVVKMNYDEAFAPLIKLRRDSLIALSSLFLLTCTLAFRFGKDLVIPIRRMTKMANKIAAHHQLASRLPISGVLELRQLAHSFNKMTEQLIDEKRSLELRVEQRTKELTQANNELNELLNLHSEILQHSAFSIITTTTDGIITVFNRAAEQMLGYSAEEVIGKQTPAIIHDANEVLERAKQFSEELQREVSVGFETFVIKSRLGLPNEHEWIHIRKDGSQFHVLLSISCLKNEDGEITGFLGIGVDITQRRAIEQELQRSKINLDRAQKVAKIGSWHINANNELEWSNETYRIFGLPRNTPLDYEKFLTCVHPDDREMLNNIWLDALQGSEYRVLHRIFTPKGELKWVREQAELIFDDNGKLIDTLGTAQDVTQYKLAELALRESESRFRSIFERANLGIAFADAHGNLLQVNQSFLNMLQYSQEELQQLNFADFTHPDDLNDELKLFQEICKNHSDDYRLEKRYLTKHGTLIWVDLNVTVIRDETGNPVNFVGLVVDITERKNAEAQLVNAKKTAESASRAKSEFLANMSHEIRTPMNAILGLTQLVLESDLSTQQRDFLSKVFSSSKALLGVLNDVLDYSKIEAGHLEVESIPCHIEEVLTNVADLFAARIAEKGLELFLDIHPCTPHTVLSDPLRLSQVLNNLVSNAIKFTQYGEIYIKVEPLPIYNNKPLLRFSVKDTGIGLLHEQAEQLFKPFTQADSTVTRKYGGTGLGLAICQRLVSLMGGEIHVESELGGGATFTFTIQVALPLYQEQSLEDLQRLKGQRVLVVDDQPTSIEILQNLLEMWGLEVETALSGKLALEKIEAAHRTQTCFDAVLIDWQMPDIDGLEVARRLRENNTCGSSMLIIMVTGHDKEKLLQQVEDLHIHTVLTKPVLPSNVFNALLNNRNYATPLPLNSQTLSLADVNLLLVEDHEINQQVAKQFLKSRGAKITVANNGLEAIACVESQRFDAILMDLHMPQMDGIEATRQICQMPNGNVPIIAMTAAVMNADKQNCEEAGMVDFISKPIQIDELLNTLHRWSKKSENTNALRSVSTLQTPKIILPTNRYLDTENVLRLVDYNLPQLQSWWKNFVLEQQDTLTKIYQLLEQKQTAHARQLLHALKGVSANLGATKLKNSAAILEQQVLENQPLDELENFENVLNETFKAMQTLCENVISKKLENNECSPENFLELLKKLRPYLLESELIPQSLLESLNSYSYPDNPALIDTLQRQIDNFDFDNASNTLETLITQLTLKMTADAND